MSSCKNLHCQRLIPTFEGLSLSKESCKKKQVIMNMREVQYLCFIIHKFKIFLPGAKAVRQMEYISAFRSVQVSAMLLC